MLLVQPSFSTLLGRGVDPELAPGGSALKGGASMAHDVNAIFDQVWASIRPVEQWGWPSSPPSAALVAIAAGVFGASQGRTWSAWVVEQ